MILSILLILSNSALFLLGLFLLRLWLLRVFLLGIGLLGLFLLRRRRWGWWRWVLLSRQVELRRFVGDGSLSIVHPRPLDAQVRKRARRDVGGGFQDQLRIRLAGRDRHVVDRDALRAHRQD